MSLRLTIVGKSVADLNEKILAAASEIEKTKTVVSVGTKTSEGEFKSRIQQSAERLGFAKPGTGATSAADLADSPANARPFTAPQAPAAPSKPRRGPKTKAEKAAEAAAAAGSVDQALAFVAPAPPMPSMPTTQHRVQMPMMNTAPQAPAPQMQQAAPTFVAPPVQQTPVNAYSFESFKANFLHILNILSNEGKIDNDWLAGAAPMFGNKPVHEWPNNQTMLNELFQQFVAWEFIQEIR